MTKEINIFQLIPAFLLSLALIFAIHFKGTAFNLLYMTIASGLLLTTACLALHHHIIKQRLAIPFKLPHIICFVWIAWLFISINWSHSLSNSWYYSWVVGALPFSFLLWSWIKPLYKPQTIFNIILSIVMFYAFWAIIEFINTSRSTMGPTLYQGIFGALFAGTIIPVISNYISRKQKNSFSIYPPIIFILLLALFSTFSRGSMLSYLMVLPVLFFTAYRQNLPIKNSAITILILTIISYIIISQYSQLTGGQSMEAKTGAITEIKSMSARLKLYQSMLDIYSDYPLLGTGLATFNIFYRSYRDPTEHSSGQFGHNDYLQYLQEGGPLLLSFLLLALALISWIIYRCAFKTKAQLQTTGFALASATFFIHAAADIIFYIYALTLLAGLFLSMSYHSLETAKLSNIKLDNPKLTTNAAIAVLFIGWLSLTIDTRINTHLEWQYLWNKAYPSTVANIETLETYHKLSPHNPTPIERLAEFYLFMRKEVTSEEERKAMAQQALDYTLKLIDISPRFSRMYLRLAELVTLNPELKNAIQEAANAYDINPTSELIEQLLKKSINLDPNNNLASLTLADYYLQQQKTTKALTVLNNAIIWLKIPKTLFSKEAYLQDYKYQQQIIHKINSIKKHRKNQQVIYNPHVGESALGAI